MVKKLLPVMVALLLAILLASALPSVASAAGSYRAASNQHNSGTQINAGPLNATAMITVYVDLRLSPDKENGTQALPYNTENEGISLAQTTPGGAYVQETQTNSQVTVFFVKYVKPTITGVPLSPELLYILLATLALVLIMAGWWLRRRAMHLKG